MMASPHLRRLALGLCLAVVLATAGPALAREDREIKRMKRALVGIERVLQAAEDEREPLGPDAWTSERHIDGLQNAIRRAAAFGADEPVLGSFVELVAAQAHHQATVARMEELDVLIEALREKRSAVIAELQDRVLQASASKATNRSVASWSTSGHLITYSADWEAVAACESSGRWHVDARYDGGLQFDPLTWLGFGGGELARHAFEATKKEQITIAERVLAIQGSKAWPVCFTPLSTL
jgi:Transglycosylase-like domain